MDRINNLIKDTHFELVNTFNKSEDMAKNLIEKTMQKDLLKNNPNTLTYSSYDWAMLILIQNNQLDTMSFSTF